MDGSLFSVVAYIGPGAGIAFLGSFLILLVALGLAFLSLVTWPVRFLVLWLRPALRLRPGALFFCYVGLYSIGRFAIEALRLDSFWLGSFRVPQLARVAGLVIAVIGLAWVHRHSSSAATTA